MTALAVTITLVTAMIRPFGRPFKVTDKGGDRSKTIVRWRMAGLFGGMSLLSAGSIIWAFLGPYSAAEISPLDYFNLLWAGISMLLTFISFLVCFELPRTEFLFDTALPGSIERSRTHFACTLTGLSLGSARARLQAGAFRVERDEPIGLTVEPFGVLEGRIVRQKGEELLLELRPTLEQRRELLVFLFSRPMHHVAANATMSGAVRGLLRRAFVTG